MSSDKMKSKKHMGFILRYAMLDNHKCFQNYILLIGNKNILCPRTEQIQV
jgi:hypothetical protein